MPQNGSVHSRPISGFNTLFARYAFISTLVAIALGLGFGVYNQFFTKTAQTLAVSSIYELNKSGNTIAFQGRLSRLNGNPVNTPVAAVFKIFDAGTGGNELYNSTTGGGQTITPDNNGNFSVVIGQTNGLPIPDSVFANRNQVWLEFTANNQIIPPRQPISITGVQPPIPTPISIGATLSSTDLLKLDSLNISPRAGSILFGNGTSITNSSVGSSGQVLMSDGNGSVFWANLPPGIGGNYVGTISGNDQIGVTGSGSPNASVSLSIKDGSIGDTQLSFKTGQNLRTSDSPTFSNLTISSLNNAGSVIYSTGTSLSATSVGTSGQFLMSNGTAAPSWNTVFGTGTTYTAGAGLTLSNTNVFSLDLNHANTWVGLQTFNSSGAPFAVGSTTLVTNLNAQYLNGVDSSGFDNYNNWKLQSNGTGTTSILSGNTVNFVNGVGISLSQSGSTITINDVVATQTYTAGAGLTLSNTNVFSLDLNHANTWVGLQTFNSSGAPFAVGSTTLVTNLNANYLNGFSSSNLPYVNNATDGTLTRSGTGPYTLALNLGSSNVWTGLQTFGNINVGGTFISVGSTNLVTNLNANYLNGFASSYFINVGQTGSLPYDNYNNWKLQSNGTGTTSILSGNTVNFVDGVGISLAQSGSTITVNNTGVVGATNGLSVFGANVGLGGTLTQNTNIGTSSFNLLFSGLGNTQSLSILSSGNVGIGLTATTFNLSVLGDEPLSNVVSITNLDAGSTASLSALRIGIGTSSGNQSRFVQFYRGVTNDNDGTGVGRINLNNAGVQYSSGAADFAEYMNITESVADGDIIATSGSGNKKAIMGDFVLGVVSDSAAFVGNATSENPGPGQAIVGTMGLVNTKVSNENGNIAIGDPICASATNPGVGVKAKKAGPVIGKALAAYSSGTVGRIAVQVSPGWYDPDALLTNPNSFTLSGSNVLDSNGAIVTRVGGFEKITTSTLTIGSTALVNNFNAQFLNGLTFDNLPYVNNVTDSTLTRSGTGPYTIALNLGSSNTWTGIQTFGHINLTDTSDQINFGTSGSRTILSANTQLADRVVTIPAITSNDILVLNNKGATLTNKTIDAASNTITGLTTTNLSATAGILNSQLANSSITIGTTAGSGLSGGGTIGLGGTLNLTAESIFGSPGIYGSATQIPVLTINSYGDISNVTNTTISGLTSANLSATAGITNAQLSNSSISVNAIAGTGIGVSNSPVSLGGDLKLFGINATNTVKGVASFDATNFSVTNGAVDTIQDINIAATPSFSSLFLTNTSNQLSLGTSNTTIISSLAPSTSRTAFIPALSSNDTFVFVGQTQTLTSKTIDAASNTISGLTNSNLSGSAGITDANLATITTANKVSGSAVQLNANGGITNSTGLSLLTSCSSTQILKWNGTAWVCAADNSGGTPAVYPDGGLLSDGTGLSLIRTCPDGQILKWFAASGWICHADNTGGSGSITVEEADESVTVGGVVELQFGPATNSSDEFIVLDIGSSKARVRTGNKVVLTDLSQTLTNKTISGVGNTITNIADSSLNTITTANKVSGSAVQLAVGGGLTNNSGLSLLTSCADQSLLLWNSGTSSWECAPGGHPFLNFLLGATASNSINNGDFAQVWNWNLTTAAKTAFTFGENIASTNGAGAQYILGVSTKAGSTAAPFKVVAQNNTIIDTTATGGVTIGNAASGQPIEIHSGTGGINIGNGANEKTINIGSIDGASAMNLLTGTGGFVLNGAGATNYSIGTSTTSGIFTIGGTAQTGTANLFTGNGGMNINLGTGTGANNIIIGNDTTTTGIEMHTGSGNITLEANNGTGIHFTTNTVTDDTIRIAVGLNLGTTSFEGTITEADLSAARTWTFQNNSGIIPLSTSGNSLFFTTSGATNLTLPTSGTVTALGNSTTGSGSTLVLSTSPTFGTSIFTPLIIGGAVADNTLTLAGNNALSGNTLTNVNTTFKVGDSSATTAMAILNNGYVGIGTTAPAGPLEIVAQNDFFYITKYSNDVFSPGVVGRKARGTIDSPLAVQTNDKLASFGGRGYDGTGFPLGVLQSSGAFQVVAGENFTTSNKGTYLGFYVTPLGSTTRSEKMRLDTTGTLDLFNTTNQLSLGVTNTTTISALAPTSSVVATIPALIGNDTFVFIGQTQTLTSKTISGTNNTLSNIGNASLTNSSLTVTAGVGLSGGGTISLGSTATIALNLGSSNVWTAQQTFNGGISTTTSTALIIDSGTSGAINIGTNANAKTISIGNTVGATTLNFASGTGGINIGVEAIAKTISIGTGAANNTINIGTTNDGSTVNIISGTGNINFNVGGNNISGKVIIGNSGTTAPDLLVLDNGTTDPTGINGAMYYNSTLNKFRCFEGNTWRNCVGSDTQQVGATFAAVTLGTGSSLLGTFSITPTTNFGDVYIDVDLFTNSLSNTNQTITGEIRSGTTCAGTLLASGASALTNANATDGPGVFVSALISNPGTSAQNYAICANSSLSGGARAGGSASAIVIDTGADLAEIYNTNDSTLEPGDVVSFDPALKAGMKKSQKAYDPEIFGIISTKPGLLIGDGADQDGVKALPVALSGRVPLKVTTENGEIKTGDYLTSSSTPGVAMKATKAGNIIGQAITPYNGQEAGKIIVFIKNGVSNGAKFAQNLTSIDILASLIQQNNQIIPAAVDLSQVVTDKAIAGVEMVSPKITAQDIFATNATISGTLKVNTLQADKIEGLNFDSQLATLEGKINSIEATHSSLLKTLTDFYNLPIFKNIVEFFEKVIFHNRIQFEDKDMGGYAVIRQSTGEIEVKFDKPYEQIPVVNVSLVFENDDIPTFIENGKNFIITNLSKKGFKISLLNLASRDFKYHWTALNMKDAKTFIIEATPIPTQTPTSIPTPTLTPVPSPILPTETIIPTQTPSPTPTI